LADLNQSYNELKEAYLADHDHYQRLYPDPDLRSQKFDSFIRNQASNILKNRATQQGGYSGPGWGGNRDYLASDC